jgi:transcriptional regulator with XRE-family HTH domain
MLSACSSGHLTLTPALPFCSLKLKSPKPIDRAYPAELRSIGDHVRKRRLDLGLLQREVALRVGVDKTTVFNWETGTASPNLRALPAVIRFLGYDPRPSREAADPGRTPACPARGGPGPADRQGELGSGIRGTSPGRTAARRAIRLKPAERNAVAQQVVSDWESGRGPELSPSPLYVLKWWTHPS